MSFAVRRLISSTGMRIRIAGFSSQLMISIFTAKLIYNRTYTAPFTQHMLQPDLHQDRCSILPAWYGTCLMAMLLISTVPSFTSATSDSKRRFTRPGCVLETRIRGPFGVSFTSRIHFDSLSRLEGLTLHLLILSKDRICLAKIYAYIMSYHTLYNAGNNFFLIAVILVKQNFSLFLTDFLKDYVLCILCCNTAKFVRVNRYLQDIANLCIGILLLCF